MTLNEHNVFIDGYEEIEVGCSYRSGLRVRFGEREGKWGYVLSYENKTSGTSRGLTPRDCLYSSRRNMFVHAKRRIEQIDTVKELPQKMQDELFKKLDDEINKDLFGGSYE